LDTFIFQIHSYLLTQAGACGIISQRDLNEIWVWWSSILNKHSHANLSSM